MYWIGYWFNTLSCQIWFTTTKPFFRKSKANLETLQKYSSLFGVFYDFSLKSVECVNQILSVIEFGFYLF